MARLQLGATTLSMLLVLLTASSSWGRDFIVGDRGGWVEEAHRKSFNDWAERQRFHVNDTLEFKYNKDADAGVLLVSQSDYEACNTTKPLLRLDGGGDSRFVLNNTGKYYFIDADSKHCNLGERLTVVVEHLKNNTSSSSKSDAVAFRAAGVVLALACLVVGGAAIL